MKSLVTIVLALMTADAMAQERPPTMTLSRSLETEQGNELMRVWGEVCMDAYPDEAKAIAAIKKNGGEDVPAEIARGALRGEEGRGWVVDGKHGAILVTIKPSPDQHCAVRGVAAKPFIPEVWRPTLKLVAQERKAELSQDIDYDDPRQPDGGVAHVFGNLLMTVPLENYMLIIQEFVMPGKRVYETRLMRRLYSPPARKE